MFFYKVPINILEKTDTPINFCLLFKNQHNGRKELACSKGDCLDEERMNEIQERVEKGESVLLADIELQDFLNTFNNREALNEFNARQLHLRDLDRDKKQHYKKAFEDTELDFNFMVQQIRQEDDFSTLIEASKAQVESFSRQVSPYFSFLISFCANLFSAPGELPASSAFCFMLAQKLKADNEIDLMELTVAFSLREIGLAYLAQSDDRESDPDYRMYPMFSQHLVSLSSAPFSKNVSRYIIEHRELIDGSGFPRNKTHEQTHFYSHIVGACHGLFKQYFEIQKGKDFNKALRLSGGKNSLPNEITSAIISLAR